MTTLDSNVVARIRAELDRRIQSGAIAPGMAQRIGAELDRRSGRSAGPSLSQQMTAKMQASPDFYGQHISNVGLGPLDVAGAEAAVPAPPPGWRPGTEPLNVTDVPIVGPAIRLTRAITETPNEALARQYATPQLSGASGFATKVARMAGGVLDPGGASIGTSANILEQGGSPVEAAFGGGVSALANFARIPGAEKLGQFAAGAVTRSAPDVVRRGVGAAAQGAAAGIGLGEAQALAEGLAAVPRGIGRNAEERPHADPEAAVRAAIADEVNRLVEAQPELLTSGALGGFVAEGVMRGLGRAAEFSLRRLGLEGSFDPQSSPVNPRAVPDPSATPPLDAGAGATPDQAQARADDGAGGRAGPTGAAPLPKDATQTAPDVGPGSEAYDAAEALRASLAGRKQAADAVQPVDPPPAPPAPAQPKAVAAPTVPAEGTFGERLNIPMPRDVAVATRPEELWNANRDFPNQGRDVESASREPDPGRPARGAVVQPPEVRPPATRVPAVVRDQRAQAGDQPGNVAGERAGAVGGDKAADRAAEAAPQSGRVGPPPDEVANPPVKPKGEEPRSPSLADVRVGDEVVTFSKKTGALYGYKVLQPPDANGNVVARGLTNRETRTLKAGEWWDNAKDASLAADRAGAKAPTEAERTGEAVPQGMANSPESPESSTRPAKSPDATPKVAEPTPLEIPNSSPPEPNTPGFLDAVIQKAEKRKAGRKAKADEPVPEQSADNSPLFEEPVVASGLKPRPNEAVDAFSRRVAAHNYTETIREPQNATFKDLSRATGFVSRQLVNEPAGPMRDALNRDYEVLRFWAKRKDPSNQAPSRVEKAADATIAAAEARKAERRRALAEARRNAKKGDRLGASILPDIVDDVIIVAAKAVKAGVRGGQALTRMVREQTGRAGEELREARRHVRRLILNAQRRDGSHDDARFEVAVNELQRRAERKAAPTKQTIRQNTGQTPNEADTLTQREALRGSLKAEERGATAAAKAAEQSAQIQAGLARFELSKQARKAREEMAQERQNAKAQRAAMQRDAAETLRATLAVGGDQRKAVAKAMMDLPPQVRGRRDMIALVESAETPADARRAALVIQKELHRQSIKDEIRSLESTRKRIKAIPRAMKTELAAKLGELNDLLKTLKTDWTVRDALAGKKKGQPIAVRGGPMLDQYRATSERARVAAGEIREKIEQALRDRRIMLGEQAKSAGYVTKMVAGSIKAVDKVASEITWGRDRNDQQKRAGFLRWAFQGDWTVKTMAKVLDGTLGKKAVGYAEQLLFRDSVAGRRRYLGERQKATDTLDAIARKHGFRSWADLRDKAESTQVEIPWSPSGEKMGMFQALALAVHDPETRGLTDLGARLSLASKGDSAGQFTIDGDRRQRLEAATDSRMIAAFQEAKATVIEGQLAERLFQTWQNITGTTPPKVKDYFPRRSRMIGKDMQNPADIQQMDLLDSQSMADRVKLENASFSKEREAGKNAVFWIDNPFEVLDRHIDRSAKIIHLAETVKAAERVFNDLGVRQAIEEHLGAQTNGAIRRHLDQMKLLNPPDSMPGGDFMRKTTRNITRALTQLNPRSIMRQFGSAFLAAYDRGPSVLARLPEAIKTTNRERMTNSDPSLRERYENDTASAGVRAAVGDGDKTSARARIIDREQLRLGWRQLMRGDLREGNRRLWEAVKLSNLTDSVVATMTFLDHEAEVRKQNPDWSADRVTKEAGRLTADWVDDRMNTSDVNTASRFQKAMRESGWSAPFAVFQSDRVKMWNMLLEAHAQGGGVASKQFAKAAAAVTMNAVWNTAVGYASYKALLAASAAIWGKSEEDEKRSEERFNRFGLSVARELVGTSVVGEWVAKTAELIAGAEKTMGGGKMSPLLENPTSGTANQAFLSIVRGTSDLARLISESFSGEDEEPTVKAFAEKEKRIESLLKTLKSGLSAGATLAGVPLGVALNDASKLAFPSGDEFSRATVAIRGSDNDAAKSLLAARAKRMLKAGIPDYKIAKAFTASLKRRLEAPYKDKTDAQSVMEKAVTTAGIPTLVWEAIAEAKSPAGP